MYHHTNPKEPFQELDVMNNFIFNKLTSEEEMYVQSSYS